MCGGGFVGDLLGGAADIVGDVVDFGGDVIGDVIDAGGNIIEGVGDVGGDLFETVKDLGQGAIDVFDDFGHFIDDAVNDVVPGGWGTVAAITAAAVGAPYLSEAGMAAGAEGAASAGISDIVANEAIEQGIAQAAGGGFGLNPAMGGTLGLNPASVAGTGLDTAALSGFEWLGGAGSLPTGTAGLSASQIANAGLAGTIGSNAASGLGYLGGASSLPSGTAGITGVTATPTMDKLSRLGKSLLETQQQGQQRTSGTNMYSLLSKGLSPSQQDFPIGYNMNQNPFTFTAQLPIQGEAGEVKATPLDVTDQRRNMAALLRNI